MGLRPINNIVDVTNYVAHELGQPLHGFDLDRFVAAQGGEDRSARVVVRRGRDEVIACLDGVQRRTGPADMVVCGLARRSAPPDSAWAFAPTRVPSTRRA